MNRNLINGNNGRIPDRTDELNSIEEIEGISESLFEILWRRRRTVLFAILFALVAGIVYLQRATPLYTSTSRLYVEQTGPKMWEQNASGEVKRWSNYLYTQAELIQRTETLSRALNSPSMSTLQSLVDVSNPIVAIRKNLEVKVGKNDEIIDISYTGPDPYEAANIVNTVVDAYLSSHSDRRRDTATDMVTLLENEKTKWDNKLRQKQQKMIDFREGNEFLAFGTNQENNSISRSLERYQSALDQSRLDRIEAKSFYEAVMKNSDDPTGLRQLIENQKYKVIFHTATGEVVALRAELNRLVLKRNDCLQVLKPDAPAIIALETEMAQIKQQMQDLDKEFAASTLKVAQEQYLAAQQSEKELEKYLEEQNEKVIALDSQLSKYALLQSDYEQTLSFCEILNEKIRRLNIDPQVGALTIEIIETATSPPLPSHPNKARTMGLAMCLGLFAGVGLSLLREWRDTRLRSIEEISNLLGLPVLGTIPSMTLPKKSASARGQKAFINPGSLEAEAFRSLRTAIFFGVSGISKDEAKTILVTSPAPGEGKSMVVSNLGAVMAQAGHRVLLLDADFRRPMQDQIFKIDRSRTGLSSVLADKIKLEDAVIQTSLQNLHVLTVGPNVSNPAEILNSLGFIRVIKKLAKDYDWVILDSPPVTAVTDAQIIAALCDYTVLVLRAESSTRRMSMQACENLNRVNARILGVTINDISSKANQQYGYYGGYKYGQSGNKNNGHHGKHQIIEVRAPRWVRQSLHQKIKNRKN